MTVLEKALEAHGCIPWVANLSNIPHTCTLSALTTILLIVHYYLCMLMSVKSTQTYYSVHSHLIAYNIDCPFGNSSIYMTSH